MEDLHPTRVGLEDHRSEEGEHPVDSLLELDSRLVGCPVEVEEEEDSVRVIRMISLRACLPGWRVEEGCPGWVAWVGVDEVVGVREEEVFRVDLVGWEWTLMMTLVTVTVEDSTRRHRLQRLVSCDCVGRQFVVRFTDFVLLSSVKDLPVSLEDLYKGTTKKLKVTKKRLRGGEEASTLESE